MIIEFSVENYRSVKERMTLSLEAESSKAKSDNVFEASIATKNGADHTRLLKYAMIYGPNASGKSNVVRALGALWWWVTHSMDLKVGQSIPCYEPFRLDVSTRTAPVVFELVFLLEGIKHKYRCAFSDTHVIEESLDHYPKGRPAHLFQRQHDDAHENYAFVTLGKTLPDKDAPKRVLAQQLYLSQFGSNAVNDHLIKVYKYIAGLEVWNTLDRNNIRALCQKIAQSFVDEQNEGLRKQLSRLMNASDTGVQNISVERLQMDAFNFSTDIPPMLRKFVTSKTATRTLLLHAVYKDGIQQGQKAFDLFKEASAGVQALFAVGGIVLDVLRRGGVLFFSALDNSLHPDLCQFIVRLFREQATNPYNAQLVFTAHDVTLLDNAVVRKDQVWFTEKDKYGATDLFSLYDFQQAREDTKFETWYRTGKLGAKPHLQEMGFLYR